MVLPCQHPLSYPHQTVLPLILKHSHDQKKHLSFDPGSITLGHMEQVYQSVIPALPLFLSKYLPKACQI